MTSLKESAQHGLIGMVQPELDNDKSWEEWAEGYIKELEKHMMKWRVLAAYSKDADYPIAVTIAEVLVFLRGETK